MTHATSSSDDVSDEFRAQRTTMPVFEAVASALHRDRERLIAELVARTAREVPVLHRDAALASMLEASIAENIVTGLNYIARGGEGGELDPPSGALVFARTLAQRDIPLSALIRAYRIGHALVLESAFDLVAAQGEVPGTADLSAAIMSVVRISAEYVDSIVEDVGRVYETERDRWIASQSGVRQQWVSDLLAPGGPSRDLAAASAALEYPLLGRHLPLALRVGDGVPLSDAARVLERAVDQVVLAVHGTARLVVPEGEEACLAWVAVAGEATHVPADLPVPPGVLVATGWPADGLEGFRRGAAQVRFLLDRAPRDAGGLVGYDTVAVEALLAAAGDDAGVLVARVLGDLAAPTARAAMLRGTLAVFLRHRGSYQTTAARMNLHRNSVQYRVQQALALLPDDVRGAEDDLALRLALAAVDA